MKDQMNLFNASSKSVDVTKVNSNSNQPLAFKVRPKEFDGYFGHTKIVNMLKNKLDRSINHFIFWGPPGCGKTTIANIIAAKSEMELYKFNAVMGGVKDLRVLIQSAKDVESHTGKKSIIFIDEIHRFNKAQQDALLPYLESNEFILFGATTEYPQTSLNRAIISRVELVELKKLNGGELSSILNRAAKIEDLYINDMISGLISKFSNGDARVALNKLEHLNGKFPNIDELDEELLITELLENSRHYDKNSNRHYDVISAFIKSIRGSDPDSALLWLAIMLDGNEQPEFIARRLIISASEDVGNANPDALQIATNAHYAVKNIGMPEARIILAQATTYLASSPKSNAAYLSIDKALEYVRSKPTIDVPGHLQNYSPEKKDYKYPHSFERHYVKQNYRNAQDNNETFYEPTEQGFEVRFKNYLDSLK
jgi:putative ATPase